MASRRRSRVTGLMSMTTTTFQHDIANQLVYESHTGVLLDILFNSIIFRSSDIHALLDGPVTRLDFPLLTQRSLRSKSVLNYTKQV